MGIVSLVVEYNCIIIVGIDTFCCKGHESINKLLTAHVERLRARPELKDAWIIFIPEANLGHEGKYFIFQILCSILLTSLQPITWNTCFVTIERCGPCGTSNVPEWSLPTLGKR